MRLYIGQHDPTDTCPRGNVGAQWRHTNPRQGGPPFGDQLGHDAVHHVHRNCKTDAGKARLCTALPSLDGGIDAYQAPGAVEQRTARVARVDGSVSLDHAHHLAVGGGGQFAIQRTDNTLRQGTLQAKRVANGIHLLSHANGVAFTQRNWLHITARQAAQPDHSQVIFRRPANDAGLQRFTRIHLHKNAARVVQHMVAGDDMAQSVPQEPTARRLAGFAFKQGIGLHQFGGDVSHGRCRVFKQTDHALLIGRQVASRRDCAHLHRRFWPSNGAGLLADRLWSRLQAGQLNYFGLAKLAGKLRPNRNWLSPGAWISSRCNQTAHSNGAQCGEGHQVFRQGRTRRKSRQC